MSAENEPTSINPDALNYEQARDQLVNIVQQLESGQAPLEATLEMWERGEALANRCRSILDDAQQRLNDASSGQHLDETAVPAAQ